MVDVIKSANITDIEADPIVVLDRKSNQLEIHQDIILDIPVANFNEIGDVILIGLVPTNALISDIQVVNDALDFGNTLAVDVGLFYGFGGTQKQSGFAPGAALDPDAFAAASDVLQAATQVWAGQRFLNAKISGTTEEAWQIAGLAEDPGGYFYTGFTVTTVATTPQVEDIALRISYIV